MRQNKRWACVLLAMLLLVMNFLPSMQAEAGLNETYLDGSTLAGGEWNNPESDVITENNMLKFPKTSTEYTRLITKREVKQLEGHAELVALTASMKVQNIPAGKTFIIAFGLSEIESLPGDAGNIEVVFSNQGGIKVGIVEYDQDGEKKTVCNPKACGMRSGQSSLVAINIKTDGTIRVSVNGAAICSGKISSSGEGRVGFLQSGNCEVEISELGVKHWQYSRPENANVSEGFERGGLDLSVLTAKMVAADDYIVAGQAIEEYKGKHVLMFRNTFSAYVGTQYQYSNFKLTFDVPYLQSEEKLAEDGVTKLKPTKRIAVAFGGEASGIDVSKAGEAVVFGDGYVCSMNDLEKTAMLGDMNPYADGGRPFSVQLTVVDGVVTAAIKELGESKFHTVLSYKPKRGIPAGHIDIWALEAANFAIDNIKIENLDDNPNVIETEFKSSEIKIGEIEYTPPKFELSQTRPKEEENRNSWYLLIPMVAVGVIIALGVTAVVVRKKEKKGAENHEE